MPNMVCVLLIGAAAIAGAYLGYKAALKTFNPLEWF